MLTFRPHTVQYSTQAAGSVAANGDYTEGTRTWGSSYPAIAEPAGKANVIEVDGKRYSYSYTVSLDASVPSLQFGDRVRLYQGATLLGEYDVIGFHRYQLKCKLWV